MLKRSVAARLRGEAIPGVNCGDPGRWGSGDAHMARPAAGEGNVPGAGIVRHPLLWITWTP